MLKWVRATLYEEMNRNMSRLASGDFSKQFDSSAGSRSPLMSTMGRMTRGLRSLIRVVERSSKGLNKQMEEMSGNSAMIAEQVSGVTTTIREMATGMQDASGHVYNMAEEMGRIHVFLQEINVNNRSVIETASRFSLEVASGKRDTASAAERMHQISADTSLVNNRMNELEAVLGKISEMTAFIQNISDQTQLLSLNANIEAAHAGEQGRGFAIVAKEISKLAAMTKAETEEIHQLIKSVHQSTEELNGSIDRMRINVGFGEEAIRTTVIKYDEMDGVLNGIVHNMKAIDGQLNGAAASTLAITDSVNQTSAMIQQISAGSQEVLASAEVQLQHILQLDGSIQEAARNSLSLRSVVSQFKLPSRERSHPLQRETDQWMECALSIRAIMVSMIESRDSKEIKDWNLKKIEQEKRLSGIVEELVAKVDEERDRMYLAALRKAWNDFAEAKEQNARWMLAGEYDKAKEGLVNKGRLLFRTAMDVAEEWMEQFKQ
ncbi:hypothetical protein KZ483_26635 [Paenibacillus sp. sptzw28]|uniref:methyl-accepting chemotaxis protein n=1 Tax=Paenibacillus sp. sptzw28 TaxID=715179 RepID=UPI001C6EB6BA|nr:methyl-accepting chemotaxis protein [Paenibacillus sp. sptzw28]QYR21223.1 hypothetical protein KZ483_26635 [Paenibacillus sp. sptzw28]